MFRSVLRFVGMCILLTPLGLTACDSPSESGMASRAELQASLATAGERLALGLAVAAEKPHVRRAIIAAMRKSPYAEHKVRLQEFMVATPSVAEAVAAALGLSLAEVEAMTGGMPPSDFYAPFRNDRRTWNGSQDVLVGHTSDVNSAVFIAFTGNGDAVRVDARSRPTTAILLIQPAEALAFRLNRPDVGSGSVIEEANDGGLAAAVVVRNKAGRPVIIRALQVCNPEYEDCGGGGGGGGGGATTYLTNFQVFYGDGVGSAEVEYSVWDDADHSETVRFEDVEKGEIYGPMELLWIGALSYNDTETNVELTETDAFSDDDWGWGVFRTNMRGGWSLTEASCFTIGDPNTDQRPECTHSPWLTQTSVFRINW